MKKLFITLLVNLFVLTTWAQLGIGTTTPNSTLDVRGSLATSYRAFTTSTSASSTDNLLVFTGTSAATLTLPTAVGCPGRSYMIKNASTTGPTPVLTIATTSSQTIDVAPSWTLSSVNETITLISNGSGWNITAQSLPGGSGTNWSQNGNSVPSLKSIGTISNFDLPFITNNTEKMRVTGTGNVGIGASTFNGTNPEKLLVDAGTTTSVNAIVGKGNIDSYLQLNIQNNSTGTSASSDVVATANNGSETTNYVDMGINGGNYSGGIMGTANDAYLYNMGQNFLVGTGTAAKSLVFMTGGTSQAANERMRIDGTGNVGIGITNPSYKLHVNGTNPLFLNGVQTGAATDSLLTIINGVVKKLHPSALTNAWSILGNAGTNPASNFIGTTDAQALVVRENNIQVGRFEANSIALGNGSAVNTATHSYAIGSNATIAFGKTKAVAVGFSASATADNSFAIGNSASATANNGFAIGNSAATNSADAVSIGTGANTGFSAANAIAIGNAATANSPNAIAIGAGTTTAFSLTNPIVIGNGAIVNGSNGVVLGNGSIVGFAANATAIGAATTVSGANSTAIGYNTSVSQSNAVILGDRSNASLAVGIGTEGFSGSNREKLLVDAGASGNTSYQNVIVGKGNTDSYAQLNIQNINTGTAASSDVVATANNGSETVNFIDMGINGGGNTTTGVLGGANTAYLYATGNDFAIGNGSNTRNLNFFTTTGGTYTERMRITSAGNIGIANTAPSEKLDVTGNVRFSGALMPGNTAGTAGHFLISTGAGTAPIWFDASGYAWLIDGNNVPSIKSIGTTNNFALPFITNNTEKMRITTAGDVGIGTSTFSGTNPEQLLVNAGSPSTITDFQNVIVGKGNTNSYAQLNIQNTYSAAGNSASSDVVATSDNGNESVNFIDMGINSGTNTTTGILGGGNTAYLYSTGNNFAIGNSTAAKDIMLFTGGTAAANERMRITGLGDVGIGTSTFSGTNPEQLLVNAGTPGTITDFQNVIVGKGNTNSYAQLNIQNTYSAAGNSASSDVVATSDNGNESVNFIDMGINSGTNTTTGILGGGNTAYLYSTGNNFAIGNSTAAKDIMLFTGGTAAANERMRVTGTGNVGIGNTAPTSTLQVTGSTAHSIVTKTTAYAATASDYTIVYNNSGAVTLTLPAASGATGRVYVIKKISAAGNNLTIDGNLAETIDGAATRVLTTQYESVMIQCDGTSWYILSKHL